MKEKLKAIEKIDIDTGCLSIEIVRSDYKSTLFGRIKTKIWNFILPPHIYLKITKKQ